ncbi:cAMP-dependent protein kinase type II-beta regulatory subunit, partial [Branchiostoma belcheri]
MSQGKEDPGHNTTVNGRFRSRGQKRAGVYASSEQEDHMDVASDDDISDEPPPKRILDSYKRRRQSVCAERYDPDADDEDDDKKVVHPKSDSQRTRLAQAVASILLFKSLDPEQMQEVLDAMFERK